MKELINIQTELKCNKSQFNKFGKYNYRTLEDIMEALKPLLKKEKCFLLISDDIVQIGERYYIKATATISNVDGKAFTVSALAREAEKQAGMQDSQLTGATSSYARKYCLNGLFCIDDTKDADAGKPDQEPTLPKDQTDETYLSKMAGFAKFEEKTYWSIMGQSGYTNAREITDVKEQKAMVKKIMVEISKGK